MRSKEKLNANAQLRWKSGDHLKETGKKGQIPTLSLAMINMSALKNKLLYASKTLKIYFKNT